MPPSPTMRPPSLPLLALTTVAFSLNLASADLNDGLIAFWPLDEIVDGETPDQINEQHMTLVNLSEDDLVPGVKGQAFLFDASRQTLLERISEADAPLPANDRYDAWSVSLWVKGKGTGQNDLRVFSEGSTESSNPLFNIGTANNGADDTVDIYIRGNNGTINHPHSLVPAFDDAWRLITWTQDGNDVALYIDGVRDEINITSGVTPLVDEGAGFRLNTTSIGGIRRGNPSHWWSGAIDEVAMWDRALTESEVEGLFEGGLGFTADDPNLRAPRSEPFLIALDGCDEGAPTLTRELTLTNDGESQLLEILSMSVTGPDREAFTLTDFPTTLDPGESGTVTLTLDTANLRGSLLATLEITSNDPGDPLSTIDLSTLASTAHRLIGHYPLDELEGERVLDRAQLSHGHYVSEGNGRLELGQEPLASGGSVRFISATPPESPFIEVEPSREALDSFSVSLWVRKEGPELGTLFAKGEAGSSPAFAALFDGQSLTWFNEDNEQVGVGGLAPGETYHVVFAYQDENGAALGADHLAIYVNGEAIFSLEDPPAIVDSARQPFHFGSFNGTLGFDGWMDEIQIYSKALTEADARFLFDNPGQLPTSDASHDDDGDGLSTAEECTQGTDPNQPDTDGDGLSDGEEIALGTQPLQRDSDGDGFGDGREVGLGSDPLDPEDPGAGAPDESLIAYWPLDELNAGQTPDANGRYPLTAVNLDAGNLTEGRIGKAIAFSNAQSTLLEYLAEPGDALPINLHPERTISLWIKAKGTGQNDLRFFAEASTDDNGPLFNLGTQNNGQADTIDLYIRPGGRHEYSDGLPLDDTWRHLAWVEGDGEAQLYIDGELDGRTDWSVGQFSQGMLNSTSIGGIRRASPSHWFTGLVDEVSLWSRKLSGDEIAALASGLSATDLGGGGGGGGQNPGGDPDPPGDGNGPDTDRDGVSDTLENLAGTDPNDHASYLRVVETESTPLGIRFSWSSIANRPYEILYSNNLQEWQPVGTVIGAAGTTQFIDPDPARAESPRAYYRVRTE